MRGPLSVRIDDGVRDQHVTRAASGLRIRRIAGGGCASIDVNMDLGAVEFTDLGGGDRLYVYGPDGATVAEGFIDNPGAADGTNGQSLALTAFGPAVLASDRSQAVIYIDADTGSWEQVKADALATSANASASDDPTPPGAATSGLLCQFNPGQPVATNARARIGYAAILAAGMEVGGLGVRIKSGKVDTGYRADMVTGVIGSTTTTALTGATISTVQTPTRAFFVGVHFPTGQTGVALQLRRAGGATNVADDDTWTYFDQVVVLGRRVDAAGVLVDAAGMASTTQVLAHQVVADMVGRGMLGRIDPSRVTIETTAYPIDQLAYPDGVKAAQVLEDLALYEPDMVWSIADSTAAGFAFTYRAWGTTPRYEVSTRDGYTAPGADDELANRIAVTWTDATGQKQSTPVMATSAQYPALKALEDAGRVKDADPIALLDGQGSLANAQQIGAQVLATKAVPPKSARVTVRRPVKDLLRGGWAMPWEVEPGYLAVVRETGDVLRVTETDYDHDDRSVLMTLGTPQLTNEQRLARLVRAAQRK